MKYSYSYCLESLPEIVPLVLFYCMLFYHFSPLLAHISVNIVSVLQMISKWYTHFANPHKLWAKWNIGSITINTLLKMKYSHNNNARLAYQFQQTLFFTLHRLIENTVVTVCMLATVLYALATEHYRSAMYCLLIYFFTLYFVQMGKMEKCMWL